MIDRLGRVEEGEGEAHLIARETPALRIILTSSTGGRDVLSTSCTESRQRRLPPALQGSKERGEPMRRTLLGYIMGQQRRGVSTRVKHLLVLRETSPLGHCRFDPRQLAEGMGKWQGKGRGLSLLCPPLTLKKGVHQAGPPSQAGAIGQPRDQVGGEGREHVAGRRQQPCFGGLPSSSSREKAIV